ncbi:hypothetical protein [Planktothricoides raciborskii]|uniref:Uncharacterized protein n=1 Tax=Planktothricoides raciborskii GIHE-MW2 TaxID=2792601 RepID=A0AAU8JHQ9_9CYAN
MTRPSSASQRLAMVFCSSMGSFSIWAVSEAMPEGRSLFEVTQSYLIQTLNHGGLQIILILPLLKKS